ncbi:hypothetical protein [Streptomyces sp. NRRL S-448]|uniref:hypothetical protein n=1 Tax=Streptomyces sp. NRRL S-448 TaxID=1463907 RepID=UPI0035642CD3
MVRCRGRRLRLTLSLPTAAHAAAQPATPAPAAAAVPQVLPIGVAVSALPIATEDRTGYQRTSFRHWNAGDIPADGCNTRPLGVIEVVAGGCSVVGQGHDGVRYGAVHGDVLEPGASGGAEDGRAVEGDIGVGEDGVVEQAGQLLARVRRRGRAGGGVGGGGGDGLRAVGEVGQHQVQGGRLAGDLLCTDHDRCNDGARCPGLPFCP